MDFKAINIANTSFDFKNMVQVKKPKESDLKQSYLMTKHNFMDDFDSRRTFAGFKFERIVNWLAC